MSSFQAVLFGARRGLIDCPFEPLKARRKVVKEEGIPVYWRVFGVVCGGVFGKNCFNSFVGKVSVGDRHAVSEFCWFKLPDLFVGLAWIEGISAFQERFSFATDVQVEGCDDWCDAIDAVSDNLVTQFVDRFIEQAKLGAYEFSADPGVGGAAYSRDEHSEGPDFVFTFACSFQVGREGVSKIGFIDLVGLGFDDAIKVSLSGQSVGVAAATAGVARGVGICR